MDKSNTGDCSRDLHLDKRPKQKAAKRGLQLSLGIRILYNGLVMKDYYYYYYYYYYYKPRGSIFKRILNGRQFVHFRREARSSGRETYDLQEVLVGEESYG